MMSLHKHIIELKENKGNSTVSTDGFSRGQMWGRYRMWFPKTTLNRSPGRYDN